MREQATINPFTWSVGWRRAFIVTLPVSLPIWIVAAVSYSIFRGLYILALAILALIALSWDKNAANDTL